MSMVVDEAAGQLNVSSDSVHIARYYSSLCDCLLLAMELWTNPHSSTRMKEMYPKWHQWSGLQLAKDFRGPGGNGPNGQ